MKKIELGVTKRVKYKHHHEEATNEEKSGKWREQKDEAHGHTGMTILYPQTLAEKGDSEMYLTPPGSPINEFNFAMYTESNVSNEIWKQTNENQTSFDDDDQRFAASIPYHILPCPGCLLTNSPNQPYISNDDNDQQYCFNLDATSDMSENGLTNTVWNGSTYVENLNSNNISDQEKLANAKEVVDTHELELHEKINNASSALTRRGPKFKSNLGIIVPPSVAQSKKLTNKGLLLAAGQTASLHAIQGHKELPKSKKKRSIKRKLYKIHRRISTKLIPPQEESSGDLVEEPKEKKVEEVLNKSLESIRVANNEFHSTESIHITPNSTETATSTDCVDSSVSVATNNTVSPSNCDSASASSSPTVKQIQTTPSSSSLCQRTNSSQPSLDLPFSDLEPSTTWITYPNSSMSSANGTLPNSPRRSVQYKPPNSLVLSSSRSKTKSSKRSRKKKVLSPTYRQKNEDIHKYFKDIPETEKLLADHTCAFVKDILIQGRLYMCSKYICFRANILKWQTHVQIDLKDIAQLTKSKTALVFPNAIQILMKDSRKYTFTSFTARDKAYYNMSYLRQNAHDEKELSLPEVREFMQRNYGDYYSTEEEIEESPIQEFGDVPTPPNRNKKKSRKTQTSEASYAHEKVSITSSSQRSSQDPDVASSSSSLEKNVEDEEESESGDDSDVSSEGEDEVDAPSTSKRKKSTQDEEEEEEINEIPRGPGKHFIKDEMKVSLFRQYPISAEGMYRVIFGEEEECSFWRDNLVNKGTTGIEFGHWKDDEKVEGQKVRTLGYTLRLDNPIGPKTCYCAEMQIMYKDTVPALEYAVDCIVQNHGVPYADYFQTIMRYSIIRIDDDTCELRVTSGLHYRKTPWGLMKNFIEKNVWAGLAENFTKLENVLMDYILDEKQKKVVKVKKVSPKRSSRGSSSPTRKRTKAGQEPIKRTPTAPKPEKETVQPMNGGDSIAPPSVIKDFKAPNLPQQQNVHGNWLTGLFAFVFVVLLYSNYTLYQRLSALEEFLPTKNDFDHPYQTSVIGGQDMNLQGIELVLKRVDSRLDKMENFLEDRKTENDRKLNQIFDICEKLHVKNVLTKSNNDEGR